MGTSAGPSLAGIGRGGDSNLVLEMDAHDAKCYPGEPTSNLIPYYSSRNTALAASVFTAEALWTSRADSTDVIAPDGSSTTTKAVTGTTGNSYLYSYMDATFGVTMASSTTYTLSVWAKTTNMGSTTVSLAFQDRGNGAYDLSSKTITTEWQRFSLTITTGSGATSNTLIGWNGPTNSRTFYFWGWQVEQKGYATPYVVSQLLDPTAQGPSARPASINLMIHGDVGTGTSFEDSSPSKHTITTVGDTTHSAAQSKFSGESIYFAGSDDCLTLSASSDWDFGTGDFTIDYWVRFDAFSQYQTFYDYGYTASDGILLQTTSGSGGALRVYIGGGISANYLSDSSTPVIDTWYHYAVVRSSGTVTIYRDGVSVGSKTLAADIGTPAYLIPAIGAKAHTTPTQHELNGYMDEIRITKGTALWTSDFTPPTRRNLSAPVVDRSGNDNGGNFATKETTDVATYRDGEVIEPIVSAVWDYDGTDDKISIATDSVDVYCFTIAVQQDKEYTPDLAPGDSNVGFVMGGNTFNGVIMGSWTGTMTDETLSWWGYSSTPSTGSSATYIRDTITAGWHIFTFNWNGSDYDIWVDGTKRITYPRGGGSGHSGLFVGVTAITPGWSGSGWNNYFEGKMGFLRAYDKSLSDQQIIENFNQQSNRFNVPTGIVTNGLMLWLDAAQPGSYSGTGTTWRDLSNGGHHSTLTGSPTWSSDGYFHFVGTTQWADTNFIPDFINTNASHEYWINYVAFNGPNGNHNSKRFYLGIQSATSFGWGVADQNNWSSGYNVTSGSYGTVTTGQWCHLCVVAEGGTAKGYVNGRYTNTSFSYTQSSTNNPVANYLVGNWSESSKESVNQKIASVKMYDRALTAAEVVQNFNAGRQRFGV